VRQKCWRDNSNLEPGFTHEVGQHEIGTEVMTDVVVGIAVIRPGIRGNFDTRDAGICTPDCKWQVRHAAIRDHVESVTPRIIQGEQNSGCEPALQADREPVVAPSACCTSKFHLQYVGCLNVLGNAVNAGGENPGTAAESELKVPTGTELLKKRLACLRGVGEKARLRDAPTLVHSTLLPKR
jgi:hypothetical protein